MRLRALLAVSLVALASMARGDVVELKDGDRITGTVGGSGTRGYRLRTAYGRLVIPRDKIDRIVYADGRVETPSETAPAAGGLPARLQLELAITGDTFWQAWDPKEAPTDLALRLLVVIDEAPVAAYLDRQLDPDMPGAIVNTFAFDPSGTSRTLWNQTRAQPPVVKPGRVTLKLDLLPRITGTRDLLLKYQSNLGTSLDPVWTDLVSAALTFQVQTTGPTVIQIDQSRGEMSFGGILRKKRMRNVGAFAMRLATEHDGETTVLAPRQPEP